MSGFRINTGNAFHHPYQNDYAMFRQCLVANPGVSLQRIQSQLRQLYPHHVRIADRLRAFRHNDDSDETDLGDLSGDMHHRQCPRCAMLLYQTNIYALTWLTHCPLHHCEFTEVCPICGQLWPALEDIASRHCRGCGVFGLNEIDESFYQESRNLPYHTIRFLYCFTKRWKDSQHISFISRHGWYRNQRSWCNTAPSTAAIYPSFSAVQHPEIAEAIGRSLDMHFPIPLCKKTRYFDDKDNIDQLFMLVPLRPLAQSRLLEENNESHESRYLAEYDAANYILRWITRHTAPLHRVQVSSYRHLSLSDLESAPELCPYCLAFSLWYFHTLTLLGKDSLVGFVDHYPFLREWGVFQLIESHEPLVQLDYIHYFSVEKDFSDWFYRRGLEVSFIGILQLAFDLLNHIRKKTSSPKSISHPHIHYTSKAIDGGYSLILTKSTGVLEFYYEREHPLEGYQPEPIPDIDSQCHTYHEHYLSHRRDGTKLPLTNLPKKKIPYKRFRDLQLRTVDAINEYEAVRAFTRDDNSVDISSTDIYQYNHKIYPTPTRRSSNFKKLPPHFNSNDKQKLILRIYHIYLHVKAEVLRHLHI